MDEHTSTEPEMATEPEHDSSPSPNVGIPPLPTAKKRHRLLWAVGIVAVVLVALGIIGAVAELDVARTDDVVFSERFEEEPIGFSIDSDRSVDLRVVNGTYQVTIKDGSSPQLTRHVFDHTYDGLSFEATIVHPADVGGDFVFASVGCWASDSAYLLMMAPNGDVGLLETVSESTGERHELTELTKADAARPVGQPNRLRIDCVGGGRDATVVSGYVNGKPVLSVEIPGGYDSFNAIGFVLVSVDGGRFTIDDVAVRSARPEPAMSPVPPSPGASVDPVPASGACDDVFARAAEALEADQGTDALDVIGLEAPTACSSLAEAEASAVSAMGPSGARGLEEYLARSCAYVGPSAGIRDTGLCREVLSMHPELR